MHSLALSLLLLASSPAGAAPAPSATYNVRSAGANPDGVTDNQPAFQAVIDAAAAVTARPGGAGAVVSVPSGASAYMVGGPSYVDGDRLTVRGEGVSSRVTAGAGNYGGPVFTTLRRLEKDGLDPAKYRLPAGQPAYDGTAQDRRPLRTYGEVSLLVTAHPLQLGSPAYQPDMWEGDRYTWEWMCDPKAYGVVAGMNTADCPAPFDLAWVPEGFQFRFATDELADGRMRIAVLPVPAPGVHRYTVQFNAPLGRLDAWVDGKAVPAPVGMANGNAQPPLVPGRRLKTHQGLAPFTVGAAHGYYDGAGLDVAWYGCRVTRGELYQSGVSPEARVPHAPKVQPSDFQRYFAPFREKDPAGVNDLETIALFPLNDPPATHVRVDAQGYWGVGFWVPRTPHYNAALAFEGLNLTTPLQQTVALGGTFGLDLTDTQHHGGMQGVGSLQIMCAYPVRVNRSDFYGSQASYFGFHQMVYARDVTLGQVGRDGVLIWGGSSAWENVLATFTTPDTTHFYRAPAEQYGYTHALKNWSVDNETGTPKLGSVFRFEQPSACPGRVSVDGLDLGTLPASAPVVDLVGSDPAFTRVRLDVKNVSSFNPIGAALRVRGPGWSGAFDASAGGGGLDASPADAAGIRFTPAAP